MVITFPTGFYRTILPVKPDDGGNVTYVISNNSPPRTNLIFQQVPPGIELKQKLPRNYTTSERRSALAELVFTVTGGNNALATSGALQFEVGQVLDFDEQTLAEAAAQEVTPLLVPPKTEIRSDTNLLDLAGLGLGEAELALIDSESSLALDGLYAELNNIKMKHASAESQLNDNQKKTNEANKTLSAINTIIERQNSTTSLDSAQEKIEVLLIKLQSDREILIQLLNQLAGDATAIRDQINAVAQLVR